MDHIIFNISAFCGNDTFTAWNKSLLNSSQCFQKTAIVAPAYAVLAVISAYFIGRPSQWVVRTRRQLATIYVRSTATFLLFLVTVVEPAVVYLAFNGDIFWANIFMKMVQILAWLVHLLYLMSLKNHLTNNTRGPLFIQAAWLVAFLTTVNLSRTVWYDKPTPWSNIDQVAWACCLIQLCLHVIYLFSLFPKGTLGVSVIDASIRVATERTPLLEASHGAYGRFHEVTDPHHLGMAEDHVNPLSYLTFHWANALMAKGAKGLLTLVDDLHDLPTSLRTDIVSQKVRLALLLSKPLPVPVDDSDQEPFVPKPSVHKFSLFRAIHRCFGVQFYAIGLLKLFGDGLGFAGPLLLRELVTFVEDKSQPLYAGCLYALTLCGASLIATFCSIHFNYMMAKVTLRVRAAVISTIYRKVTLVSTANLSKFTTGEILTMMGTDTERIVNFCPSFHSCWGLPLQLGITFYLLYIQIGLAFLAGVAIALFLIPVNRWLAMKIAGLSVKMMSCKDRRVGLMSEILSMIKTVKLNAWEPTFMSRVMDERYGEVKALAGRKYLDAACVYFWATTPVIIPIVTFGTYIVLGNVLEPARVFTAVALFNMLIVPLNAFPWVVNGLVEAWVSVRRIERLMQCSEMDLHCHYTVLPELGDKDCELQVLIENGEFSWLPDSLSAEVIGLPSLSTDGGSHGELAESESSSDLIVSCDTSSTSDSEIQSVKLSSIKNINLHLTKGQVVGIIGRVGSGKSSLLNAVLAEMEKRNGVVAVAAVHRGFGIATQDPWLQNGSIRDNILFNSSLDISRYRTVLYVCALDEDLKVLPAGDETSCGENGMALSGGQRARVALARAVYQERSIYLLDNVLSSVDAVVARHILQHCIHGFLSGRTVLFTSHHLRWVAKADWMIRMSHGTIINQGPPSRINGSSISSLDEESASSNKSSHTVVGGEGFMASVVKQVPPVEEEGRDFGHLSSVVYSLYTSSVGVWLLLGIMVSLFLMQMSRNLCDMWLAHWVSETTNRNTSNYVTMYAHSAATFDPWLSPFHVLAHNTDFSEISNHPSISTTIDPTTRFYLSVYAMIAAANSVFTLFRAFLFAYGGICAAKVIHKRLLETVFYAKMSFFDGNPVGRILNRFSSDLYNIDDSLPFQINILLANIFGLLGSVAVTVYGLPWIILLYIPLALMYYNIQQYYRHTNRDLKRVHALSLSPLYAHFSETHKGILVIRAMRGVHRFNARADNLLEQSQRAQFDLQLASTWLNLRLQLVGLAMLTGVATLALVEHFLAGIDAGLVGLVISYALSVSSSLNGVVGSLTETERQLVSVERVNQYLKGAAREKKEGGTVAPYGWPTAGAVRFEGVYLRYLDHNPFALRNVSFEIRPLEKVGIVGRTGAGKSSLLMALFRLVELTRGRIYVDDVDVSRLSLKKLRCSLAIVSQDTFMFTGSLRENLDPQGEHMDEEVWEALHWCGVTELVTSMGGLEVGVNEGGLGLSAGQKQLLSLTRALLSRSKIVCIDEGTSQLDVDTEDLIREVIHRAFKSRTVIIIAHSVRVVSHCDKILVFHEGELVEIGHPEDLLKNKESHFSLHAAH